MWPSHGVPLLSGCKMFCPGSVWRRLHKQQHHGKLTTIFSNYTYRPSTLTANTEGLIILTTICIYTFRDHMQLNSITLCWFHLCVIKQCSFSLTFDVYEAIEEADRLEGKEVSQVFHAYFERVTVVQLEMCVHRKPQVFLYLLAQLVQQMLMEKRRPAKVMFPLHATLLICSFTVG